MRFCYLRIALLTSALAANAFADTAETDAELAASRTASSLALVRNNSAASADTETHEVKNVDDEDRAGMEVSQFAKLIGKFARSNIVRGLKKDVLDPFMKDRMVLQAVYNGLCLTDPNINVLFSKEWIRWAYLVCHLGRHFDENDYEFLIEAMSAIYDAETLSKILITATDAEGSKALAINLAKAANNEVKGLVLRQKHELASKLFHQEVHSAEEISKNRRDRILAYVGHYQMLPDEEYHILTSYLTILLKFNKNAVGDALSVSRMSSEDAALLQILLSLQNFHESRCLDDLVSIWLDVNIPPSRIVSMLVQNNAEADWFTILFSNRPSKNFWLLYLEKYNALSTEDSFTDSANLDFEQVLQILFAVVEQESPATDKHMAYSTIIKVLTAPSIARLSSSYDNVIRLTSILLLERVRPSDVLIMLMGDEAYADRFRIVFINQASKSFWVRYLKMYIEPSFHVEDLAHTANIEFQQLLAMLFDIEGQALSAADTYSASSTILKILISPEIANVIATQTYLEMLTSNWLQQGFTPSNIVYMLLLEEAEADYFKILFTNEQSSKFWEDYAKACYVNTPFPQNYFFPTLIGFFGFEDLRKMLETALSVEATIEKAQSLLDQLYWWKLSSPGNF